MLHAAKAATKARSNTTGRMGKLSTGQAGSPTATRRAGNGSGSHSRLPSGNGSRLVVEPELFTPVQCLASWECVHPRKVENRIMPSSSFRSSPSDNWSAPKPYSDPTRRRLVYGKIQPMIEDRGFLQRLFGRH
jgi:hypothetical protein